MTNLWLVRSLDEQAWGQFVDQHPQGNVFHTPEMFQVYNHTQKHQPELWAVTDDERILALLLPVHITLMNGALHSLTTRAVAYGSVLWTPSVDGCQALELLLKTYAHETKGSMLFTELRNLVCLDEAQPILQRYGFVYEPHLNYLIDLDRPTEAIFESIGSRTRKNIRHALNRGEVVVEEIKTREQIGFCYDLLSQTYRAANVPLADRSLFEAAFERLYPRGMIRFTLARVRDAPACTSVELLYKDVMYGWYGGMDRAFSKYVPNEVLTWHILRWGAEHGYRLYDFGGAGKPGEEYPVRDFKAKFGGELVSFGRNVCVHAPVRLWLSTRGYQVLRHWL
jgi:serine/alanine adding enzyme